MLHQGLQGALAGIQGDVIEVIEHARVFQFTQLGIDETAAQHGDDARVLRLDGLSDPEGRVNGAGKRHRHQHHRRLVARQCFYRQVAQRVVHQVQGRRQGLGQGVEGGLAARQRFGVADELESRVDGVTQHVRQIVQIQGGQVLGAVMQAQRAECPTQGIAAIFVHVHVQRAEPRALGQEIAAHDTVRQGGIAALKKRDRRPYRGQVAGLHGHEGLDRRRVLCNRQRVDALRHGPQAVHGQQPQHQGKRQVFLERCHPARAQKAGQVGGGRIRRIQLRHRRDDGQHA
ncbi:hypothetical protein D3C87_1398720 [compost metagenome]